MSESDTSIKEILTDVVQASEENNYDDIPLDSLILLINSERLKQLQEQTQNEFKTLKERQQQVSDLHKLMKSINSATSTEGELDLNKNPELKSLIEEAKNKGVEVDPNKMKYTKEERERLMENVRMTIDDLNVQNDMQLQTISRLTNDRYESYQMARSILKPLHESKMSHAKAIAR